MCSSSSSALFVHFCGTGSYGNNGFNKGHILAVHGQLKGGYGMVQQSAFYPQKRPKTIHPNFKMPFVFQDKEMQRMLF